MGEFSLLDVHVRVFRVEIGRRRHEARRAPIREGSALGLAEKINAARAGGRAGAGGRAAARPEEFDRDMVDWGVVPDTAHELVDAWADETGAIVGVRTDDGLRLEQAGGRWAPAAAGAHTMAHEMPFGGAPLGPG